MWLSALGGLGYVGFLIYENRTPADQAEPDPNKKTLVVLGTHSISTEESRRRMGKGYGC